MNSDPIIIRHYILKTAYPFPMCLQCLARGFFASSAHNLLILYATLSKPLGISLLQVSSFQNREKKKSLPAFIPLKETCKSCVNATKYQCLSPPLFGVTLAALGMVGMELILVTAARAMLWLRSETKAVLVREQCFSYC